MSRARTQKENWEDIFEDLVDVLEEHCKVDIDTPEALVLNGLIEASETILKDKIHSKIDYRDHLDDLVELLQQLSPDMFPRLVKRKFLKQVEGPLVKIIYLIQHSKKRRVINKMKRSKKKSRSKSRSRTETKGGRGKSPSKPKARSQKKVKWERKKRQTKPSPKEMHDDQIKMELANQLNEINKVQHALRNQLQARMAISSTQAPRPPRVPRPKPRPKPKPTQMTKKVRQIYGIRHKTEEQKLPQLEEEANDKARDSQEEKDDNLPENLKV